MIIIIMIACCCVGALGPKAELILVCAAKLGIHDSVHEEKVKVFVISRRSHEMREKKERFIRLLDLGKIVARMRHTAADNEW